MTGRTSRWFPHEPKMWIGPRETYLLLQDFNLGIVPYRNDGHAYRLLVGGAPGDRVEEALTLWNHGQGADSFVSSVASTLLTEQEVWLEMVLRPDGPNGIPFIPVIVHGVRRTATGNLIQEVPAWDELDQQMQRETAPQPRVIELDDERMIGVSLPEKYPRQLLTKLAEDLAETDLYDPLMEPWIMEGMTGQRSDAPAIDINEANRTKRLRIAQAALPIGWTAREIYSVADRHFSDYFHCWRELRFLHFKASMREQAEEALRKVLSIAGAECGFDATVTAHGVFTPPEVEQIILEYEVGKITLSTASDIIFEKSDSAYSKDRRLF